MSMGLPRVTAIVLAASAALSSPAWSQGTVDPQDPRNAHLRSVCYDEVLRMWNASLHCAALLSDAASDIAAPAPPNASEPIGPLAPTEIPAQAALLPDVNEPREGAASPR
jgi:hypothetical protein